MVANDDDDASKMIFLKHLDRFAFQVTSTL